jgi:hypothetical protein
LQNESCRGDTKSCGSADHFGRLEEDGRGNGEAEHLRRLEVDDQLEGGGLLHRQVGGLGALEDLVDIGGATVQLATVFPVLQEPPSLGEPRARRGQGQQAF